MASLFTLPHTPRSEARSRSEASNRLRATVAGFLVLVILSGVFVSCATPGPTTPELKFNGSSVGDEYAARKEVDELKKEVSDGANSTVIPRLLQLISKYPNTKAGIEARYLLGMAYLQIGSSPDAINLLNEYVRLAPAGPYAQNAQQTVARVIEEYEQRYPSPEILEAEITRLAQDVRSNPQDVDLQMQLADLLWKRGNYSKAGEIYGYVVSLRPEYVNDPVIQGRLEFLPSGSYIVLSPAEVQRRQIEAQPLECINLSSFRSGRDLFTRQSLYYAVTGQVVNRSDSTLHGVEVIVTIYGFGNVVYDTSTVTIPRLNPGEIRAFSFRFSNFENIENVDRYECVATFR